MLLSGDAGGGTHPELSAFGGAGSILRNRGPVICWCLGSLRWNAPANLVAQTILRSGFFRILPGEWRDGPGLWTWTLGPSYEWLLHQVEVGWLAIFPGWVAIAILFGRFHTISRP